jgi:MYXO-CTERM domain-containing protein
VAKLSPAGDLVYSTYLGGTGNEQGNAVAVDTAGAAYVVGTTRSLNFPTQNAFQATNRSEPMVGVLDAFVTKLSPAGNALIYSTYLGGDGDDFGNAIAVDGAGRAHVAGDARSVIFPVQRPFQGVKGGGLSDAFVTRLSVAGNTLDYSTYVGGTGDDHGNGIAVDAAGNAYLAGSTTSPNFPTKAPFQAALAGVADAFVLKLAPTGDALVYSTYLGGTEGEGARAIAVDAAGSAYVTGQTYSPTTFPTQNPLQAATVGIWPDAFVTKLSPAGSTLVYSTYLGGSLNEEAKGIVVDATGSAHVMGLTRSTDFPTIRPLQAAIAGGDDVFVTRLSPAGTAVFYSTYLGGGDDEEGAALALGGGSVYVVGRTASTNFPVQSAFQSVHGDGEYAAFVSKLSVPSPLLVPAAPSVPPRGSVSFVASNGAGYTFSIETNASGGTVHPTTGAYVAGATGSVVDKVRVTELQGGTATATVTVGPGVSLAPTSASLLARQSVTFTATGGSDAGFAYSLEANGSGGVIDTATGVYTAGAAAPATDTVKAVDSLGNSSTANVAVMPIADAGPDATDAGDAGSDAAVDASRDSGSLADAGEPGSFGGGGCGCRTSGGTGASGAAGLALSGLVAFVARRRRAQG